MLFRAIYTTYGGGFIWQETEIDYRLAEHIFFLMQENRLITDAQYEQMRDELLNEIKPVIGELGRGMSCQIRKLLK